MDKAMAESIEQNRDKFSAAEALDNQRAYYKVCYASFYFRLKTNISRQDELKYFTNAVAKQLIERYLVQPLPDIVLSPVVVTQLTDEEVGFIAAEPAEVTQQRNFLEARKDMLENGMAKFSEAMGGLRR
jgi:replicative DNA helicase